MTQPIEPTTRETADSIVTSIEAQIGQASPLLPKAFIRVLAAALGGAVTVLYKYAGFLLLQMFVRTASNRPVTVNGQTIIPLQEWGLLIGVGRPIRATQAEFTITVPVTTQTGFLRTGSQVINPATGVTYLVSGDVELNGATVTATVRAAGDQQGGDGSGVIGNVAVGDTLSFANPLANVGQDVTVAAITTVATDAEETETYRLRVIRRFQRRPQGGALADFAEWASLPPEIANAYPYAGSTPGTVVVYVESATTDDGIPTQAQLDASLASINLDQDGIARRRPVNAQTNTQPITRAEFSVRVTNLTGVSSQLATVQASIQQAMVEYFAQREPFIPGLTVGPNRSQVTQSEAAGLIFGIVSAAGGSFDTVAITEGGNNVSRRTMGQGEKAELDEVTYA